jgi:hypothetical protein
MTMGMGCCLLVQLSSLLIEIWLSRDEPECFWHVRTPQARVIFRSYTIRPFHLKKKGQTGQRTKRQLAIAYLVAAHRHVGVSSGHPAASLLIFSDEMTDSSLVTTCACSLLATISLLPIEAWFVSTWKCSPECLSIFSFLHLHRTWIARYLQK